jgi:hypothetical protein
MACIKPDGSLTTLGRSVLEAVADDKGEKGISEAVDQPVYRIRSIMRELAQAGLVESCAQWMCLTSDGWDKLKS